MKSMLDSWLDIRRGEAKLALLMFSYYYLLLVVYYFLKPARDSLFLVRLGPSQLPFVFILIALIAMPLTALYSRWAERLKLTQLLGITTTILITSFLVLRFLIQLDHPWVYYVFYIWVSIYGILATSQFWLFANEIFNPAQAKRLFHLINLGGIMGAVTGGEVTSLIVRMFEVRTENLLFFCVGFLGICILLVNRTWAIKQREVDGETISGPSRAETPPESMWKLFGTIRYSQQLLLITGIISVTMMVASFIDFQFKVVSADAFPAQEDLTSFLGRFYGRLSLVSLLFQFLFTYRFLRVLGVGGVILFLPIALSLGSVFMIIAPGLWAGVLLRGADGSFRYSIDKTGRELLFLPVPAEIKRRTKVFIDMFMDRLFRGIAGALLLLFTLVLNFSMRQVSVVVVCLLGVWLFFVLLVRKEYVDAFRKALRKREIDPDELRMEITDTSTVHSLLEALGSSNERLVVYALDMLASAKGVEIRPSLYPLLKHPTAEVRRKTIQLLHTRTNGNSLPEMESLLADEDPRVRMEAVYVLCSQDPIHEMERLRSYLKHEDSRVQLAA